MAKEAVAEVEATNIITVSAGTNVEVEGGGTEKVVATVTFNPGNSIAEAVDMFGEEIVFERWKRQCARDLGNAVRSGLNQGKSAAEVEASLADWRPDETRRASSKNPTETIMSKFAALSESQRQALIEQLLAQANG